MPQKKLGGKATTTQETYDAARGFGLFPEYNGLVGLIKALSNYATFNSFTMSSIINNNDYNTNEAVGESVYGDNLDDLFPQTEDDFVENAAGAEEGSAAVKAERKAQSKVDALDAAYNGASHPAWVSRREYLRDLLRFQAETVQSALLKKLSLNDAEELRNYIIPKGGYVGAEEGEAVLRDENLLGTAVGGGPSLFDIAYNYNYSAAEGTSGWYDTNYIHRNNQPFIRWDALAILINEVLIPTSEDGKNPLHIITDRVYDSGGGKAKLDPLNFAKITEYNEETGARDVFDFSTDPNVCMLPTQLFYMPTNVAEEVFGYLPRNNVFPKEYMIAVHGKDHLETHYNSKILQDDTTLAAEDQFTRIGNIFLNINMLNNIVDKNGNDEDYTIGNFINDIWKGVNKSCPNHNFVLTDDKESNNIFIIDLPVDQGDLPKTYHTFIPFSNKNIFREFTYTSNVPNALSATIAIQSQDPRSIQDIDGVTFAAFNKSIKNRILSKDTKPSWDKVKEDVKSNASSLMNRRRELRRLLEIYNLNFMKNLSLEASGLETLGDSNIAGVLKEYQQSGTYQQKALGMQSSFTSVIPLDFNATLDGISGMVIGNMFKIQKDRLPKAYADADIGFIVFSEEQKITAGGDWTTDISGKMVMLEQGYKYTKVRLNTNPPAVALIEEKELVEDLIALGANYAVSNLYIEATVDPLQIKLLISHPDDSDLTDGVDFEAPGPTYSNGSIAKRYWNSNGGYIIPLSPTDPQNPSVRISKDEKNSKEFTIGNVNVGGTPVDRSKTQKMVFLTTPRINNIVFTPDTITIKTIKMAPSRATLPGEPEPDMRSSPGDDIIILLGNALGPILKESVSTGGGYKEHFLNSQGGILQFPSDASNQERGASNAEELETTNEERREGIHPDAEEKDAFLRANDDRLGFYIETQGDNKRVIVRMYSEGISGYDAGYTDLFTSDFIPSGYPITNASSTLIQFAKFKLGSEALIRDFASDRAWNGDQYKLHRPYKTAISNGTLKNPFA